MADTPIHDGEFWLPSHFLNDDDVVYMNKENIDHKNGVKKTTTLRHKAAFGFPTEFPYDFSSFGSSNSSLSSPVESVVSSTESDEEDFLATLTRELSRSSLQETQKLAAANFNYAPENLEKPWVLSRSPQSTLSGIGSWSGRSAGSSNGSPNGTSQVSSPPTSPSGGDNDAWDLIYAAAGQVARLKMSDEGPLPKYEHGRGLLGAPRNPLQVPVPPLKNPNTTMFHSNCLVHTNQYEQVKQCSPVWGKQQVKEEEWLSQLHHHHQQQHLIQNNRGRYENGRCVRPLGLPQSSWPPLQSQHQTQTQNHHHHHHQQQQQKNGSGMRAVFLGGSGVKRECSGTGVFLPRRYNNPSELRKKPGCSTVLLPARVVQALNLNLNFEDMSNSNNHNAQSQQQQRFNGGGFIPNHDTTISMASTRNVLFTQQQKQQQQQQQQQQQMKRSLLRPEICLPQEWTY